MAKLEGDLGGWTASELHATFKMFPGVGSDYDMDETVRFVRGVATVVRRREAVDKECNDPRSLAVFLLAPELHSSPELPREPMLDDGHTLLAGKVWFVNAPVVSGTSRDLRHIEPKMVFEFVTNELRLGAVPAVIVDSRLRRTVVRFYRSGLNCPDECVPIRLVCDDVDQARLFSVIDGVYRQCLVTPTSQPRPNRLWADAEKFWVSSEAECRIQALLRSAFSSLVTDLATVRVYEEVKGVLGRADLHLVVQDPLEPENWVYLAVFELKVLRSRGEGGRTYSAATVKDAVQEGVSQAAARRGEGGYRTTALCCFDMRQEDDHGVCFEPVAGRAQDYNVLLWRWYLYASSQAARQAGFMLPPSGA